MTYAANETSQQGGAPVELFEFTFGSDVHYFTSAEDDIVNAGNTYLATSITATPIRISKEQRAQAVEISLPASNSFAAAFIGVTFGRTAFLTIKRFHRFDGGTPETVVVFKGTVRAVAFSQDGYLAKLSVLPLSRLAQHIPRFTFQSLCNHYLFDAQCQVVEANFRYQNTVSAVSSDGRTITVPGLDTAKGVGFATGGVLAIPSLLEYRLVLLHSSTDTLEINLPFVNSPLGISVDVLAGCDRSIVDCKTEFDNVVNFGGFAFVPLNNPFVKGITKGSLGSFGEKKTFKGVLG